MARYNVNLHFKKPSGASGGNRWFLVHATSESEAKQTALEQAKSQNPDYLWSVDKVKPL
ncbi:Uncharacterised protein [Moraxella lacunata]|uniref:Uncharacterized protein n=1 Tax=Moraxella lacunata TaxID=477 RepID=A0A378QCL7_MORLA|nr:hypothetical protein [Moraxella lacunata]STY98656.1 Uncharacterised protein [Moraxella lacunata]